MMTSLVEWVCPHTEMTTSWAMLVYWVQQKKRTGDMRQYKPKTEMYRMMIMLNVASWLLKKQRPCSAAPPSQWEPAI